MGLRRRVDDRSRDRAGDIDGKEVPANMTFINALIASLRSEEDGQDLAEYALILALIAIVAIIALIFLGGQVSKILSNVGNSV
jgi:Flp pilus assembly pilin Flp